MLDCDWSSDVCSSDLSQKGRESSEPEGALTSLTSLYGEK
jgi:hypothetical protein